MKMRYDEKRNKESNFSWHFNIKEYQGSYGDSRLAHFHDQYQKAQDMLNKNNQKFDYLVRMALIKFGTGLHPLQDIDAHWDWDPMSPPFVHTAYYEKYDCKGNLIVENANSSPMDFLLDGKVFDDPEYDLYKQKVTAHPKLVSRTGKVTVYVASKGTVRYNKTKNKTKSELEKFKECLDKKVNKKIHK